MLFLFLGGFYELSKNCLVPYFQPIIAIESSKIYGYEALGRNIQNGEISSLGDFFNSDDNDNDSVLMVDRIIREKAIKEFSKFKKEGEHLFINMKLDWLCAYSSCPQDMPTIKWLNKYNVNFSDIIIEINEKSFNNCTNKAIACLSYYRSMGIKIAIDDYGKEASNISRLASISPDIIKMDMDLVQGSENMYQYRCYLNTISEFAQTLGIEIIYEGIETINQLTNCINASGRYFQAYFLSYPCESIKNSGFNEKEFKNCFIKSLIDFGSSNSQSAKLKNQIDDFIEQCQSIDIFSMNKEVTDEKIFSISDIIPECICRIYLCNKYGYQISSNFELHGSTIELVDNYNKNWSWRNYFKNAIRYITDNNKSYITQSYRDITTKEEIYTYICSLDSTTFFFADIKQSELSI